MYTKLTRRPAFRGTVQHFGLCPALETRKTSRIRKKKFLNARNYDLFHSHANVASIDAIVLLAHLFKII